MAPARLRQTFASSRTHAGLHGRLEQFGLATVLSFLDLERRTGEILVIANDKIGRVCLRGGQVISARIDGSRRLNRNALYDLLAWETGYFAFTQRDLADAADEIGVPTAMLLVEAANRFDEASAAAF